MNIAILTTYGGYGGAPTATRRWLRAFKESKHNATLHYLIPLPSKSQGLLLFTLNSLRYLLVRGLNWLLRILLISKAQRRSYFYFLPFISLPDLSHYDLLILAWTQNTNLRVPLETFHGPILILLHDTWYLTGGCAYPSVCSNYQQLCTCCPDSTLLARFLIPTFAQRKRALIDSHVTSLLVTSQWMRSFALSSRISIPIHFISNPVDPCYKPLQLSPEYSETSMTHCYFVGDVHDTRKGFHHLLKSLSLLPAHQQSRLCFYILGPSDPSLLLQQLPLINYHWLGTTSDPLKQVTYYNACSLTLVLSEQDNSPNTISESLMCGTPVVCWSDTGCAEMIDKPDFGYVLPKFAHNRLADLLTSHRLTSSDRDTISSLAREVYSYNAFNQTFDQILTSLQCNTSPTAQN